MTEKGKKKTINNKKKQPLNKNKSPVEEGLKNMISDPKIKEKLKKIVDDSKKFEKEIVKKFGDYILGISLLPKKPENKGEKEHIRLIVLVDDSDSKKMSKEELEAKLSAVMKKIASDISKDLEPETLLLSKLWEKCYDGDYDILKDLAVSTIIYDKGMMSAIKIAEVHKTMILKKFEKYIVSYVLAGSLVKGRATKESDIDVWVVVDDTDVKRMSRAELKDKLRAIIIKYGIDAGEITGIKNKLNIQVYILTEFWDSLKEANPVIFTLLRDGVPFYDRGIFMPWKHLLKMGRIKPSQEAIDLFKTTGKEILPRVKSKLRDIGTEDLYYAMLTPAQAAIMLYGLPPKDPKETAETLREIFVKKEGILEEKYAKMLERVIKLRKDVEHGVKKEVTGKEIDELISDADKFLKRIDRLFTQIYKKREEEKVLKLYNSAVDVIREALKSVGKESIKERDIPKLFREELVEKGFVRSELLKKVENLSKWKKLYEDKKITKSELEKAFKDTEELIRELIEFVQRKRFLEIEKAKVRIRYNKDKIAELVLFENHAVLYPNIKNKENAKLLLVSKEGGFKEEKENANEDEIQEIMKKEKTINRGLKRNDLESLAEILNDENLEVIINP